jgi:hypothetical protein
MTAVMRKGFVVAIVHVAIVASLGGKLMVDRATRPRVWARAAPYDPSLPIRGRYVRMRAEAVMGPGLERRAYRPVAVSVADGQLMAIPTSESTNLYAQPSSRTPDRVVIDPALAYFIPEHVADPSIRAPGEELWVEVTLPRKGAPRPIRLGVRRGGVLTPLEFQR